MIIKMNLSELLKDIDYKKISGSDVLDIESLSVNSKKTGSGSLFIAIEGFKHKGHCFVKEAVSNGSVAVLTQEEVKTPPGVVSILVENTRESLPILCRNFYRDPSKAFKLIGITGTNGKTTTCYLIDSILQSAGLKTSLITTVESFLDKKKVSFECTTPESLDLNKFFSYSNRSKINAVCMEISSHSIDLHRIDYLDYDYFVFTNLSQDHLDYHKNMNNYFEVKNKLFKREYREIYGGRKAVINIDDSYGEKIFRSTDLEKVSYSLESGNADIRASDIKETISGIEMDIDIPGGKKIKVSSFLCGRFNIYNIMAAVGVCIDIGIDIQSIKEGIRSMRGVPGRFEKVEMGKDFTVVVDYAHTPDGLKNVLMAVKEIKKPDGKIVSVFGCGGNRDKGKREVMGRISGQLADFTVITTDNPRSETPESIMDMIEEGLVSSGSKDYIRETDRKKAVFKALNMAEKDDTVLIAGKGHENYQEFENHRVKFSDREVVREWAGQQK